MSVVPAPGGKVVAAGISNGRIAIARYNANGALDATFSPGGADGDGRLRTGIAGGSVLDVVVRPDGRIVVLASDPANDSFLYAFTAGGGTDTTFGGGTGRVNVDFFGQEVSATQLAIGPDGKLFVAGNTFLTADSGRDVVVARYTAGGAPDSAYGTGGRTVTDLSTNDTIVRQLAVDSSGRAVVLTDADGKLVLLRYQGDSPSPIVVNGTAGNDSIRVAQSGSILTVTVNNRAPRVFTTAGAARLIVNGLDGDDTLFLDKSVTFPATLNGGLGGDRLHPGTGPADVIGGPGTDAADYTDNTAGVFVSTDDKADDGPGRNQNVHSDVEIVMGGSGNDTLFGANAFSNVLIGNGGDDVLHGLGDRDVLVGGAGKDKLFGEAGDDLLIGSRTTYDNSLPFLATLRFEWQNPANDYATRISRLRAGVLGVQITSGTVPNDSAVDTLTGDTERDWFVSHAGDILADKAGDETSTRF
jgi:uncharacterized delta-60 repeat protein